MALKRKGVRAESVGRRGGRRGARATLSIVGAGRLGTALGRALTRCGFTVEAVVARRKSHARRAAELIETSPLALASTELDRLPASDILFITTPDDMLAEVATRLAANFAHSETERKGRRRRTVLHASGALSSEVLSPLRAAGFHAGSMHPLVSVSDSVQGAESLASAYFCVEGEAAALRVAHRLVRALGAKSFSIRAGDKALYHAAAVMTSGHTTALFDIAVEMLARCGLTRARARAVLLPLLRSTLENLVKSDPAHALTGTFRRADAATVQRHLSALLSQGMTEALASYILLGKRSLELAREAGARADALKEIARALAEAEREANSRRG